MFGLKLEKHTEESFKEYLNICKKMDENEIWNDFWENYHLGNGIHKKSIIKSNIDDIFLEQKSKLYGIFPFEKLVNLIWNCYNESIITPEKEKYNQNLDKIINGIENGEKFIILTNHINFGGIPLIISELKNRSEKLGIDLNGKINTIIGPALTSSSQKYAIQSMSNLLITIPKSRKFNGEIEGISESRIKKRTIGFLKEFKSKLKEENGDIFILAPTGTRDEEIRDNGNGKNLLSVIFEKDEDIKTSLKIVNNGEENGAKIVLWGMNESGTKEAGDKSNKWKKSNIPTNLKILNSEEYKKLSEEGKIMEELAKLVIDEKGNQIGKTFSQKEILNYSKGEKKLEKIFNEEEIKNLYIQRSKINPLKKPITEKQIWQIKNGEKISDIFFGEDIFKIGEYFVKENIFGIKISEEKKYSIYKGELSFTDIFRGYEECFENFIYKLSEKYGEEKNFLEKIKQNIILGIFELLQHK